MLIEIVILLLTVVLIRHLYIRYMEPENLPPGPRPYPLLGNLPHVFTQLGTLHLRLTSLAREYGSIFTIYLNGQRIIVVNKADIAREGLLEKRDLLAGRPYTFSGDYAIRGNKDIGFNDFGPTLVLQRKLAHSAIRLHFPNIEDKVNQEVDQVIEVVKGLDGTAFDPHHLISLVTTNIISTISFGTNFKYDDPEFKLLVEINEEISRSFGTSNILEVFPFLIHFPIEASRLLKHSKQERDKFLFRELERHMANHDPENILDLTDGLIKALGEAEREGSKSYKLITVDHVAMTMGDMLTAGVETTATTLRWLIGYLVKFPKIQARVHRELDDVIGNRVIHLEDRARLPYLEATIAETLRICTTLPLGVPHKAMADTTLDGYHVPKDTTVIFNLYAIHHDPEEWTNSDEFNPSRFINPAGDFDAAFKSYLPFSAGRRVCIGESIAKVELFLIASRMLHQFEFLKPEDEPLPTLAGGMGIVHFPAPYKVCAKQRL